MLLPDLLELLDERQDLREVGLGELRNNLSKVTFCKITMGGLTQRLSVWILKLQLVLTTCPVNRPLPRGEYATTWMPSSRAVSRRWPFFSIVVSKGEYCLSKRLLALGLVQVFVMYSPRPGWQQPDEPCAHDAGS